MQPKCQKAKFQSGGQYSTQIIPMLGLLPGRNKGSLEGSPTDLRRISATGGVSARQLFGVRQRKDESPADFHRQLPVDSVVSRLIYNDYRRSGADGGLPTFVWV